jgi:hypothetical protein
VDTDITQVTPKIRIQPIWVVIGMIIFTFCGGIALCLVVSTLGLNMILSSGGSAGRQTPPTSIPTQAVAAPSAAVTLASTPTQVALPTVIPLFPAFPTSVSSTPMGVNSADPADAVRTYFQWVDDNRYDLTWPMLTDHFKDVFNCCAPNYNYTGYVDWWNSIERIEQADVHTVRQDGGSAAVYMELHYQMKAGGISTDRGYIHLIYDPVVGWRFDNKTDNP